MTGFFPDFDSESGASVRGADSAVVRKFLFTAGVTIVMPSATTGGSAATTTRSASALRRRQQLLEVCGILMSAENVRRESRPAAALLHDLRRKFDAIRSVAILGVFGLYQHVAEDGILEPRFDTFD